MAVPSQAVRHSGTGRSEVPVEVKSTAAELRRRIASWPDVRVLTGEERGDRFCTSSGEFLHFHGDSQVDIRLSQVDRDRVIESGVASFHPRAHEGGWVIVRMDGPSGRSALRLAAAAYRYRLWLCRRAEDQEKADRQ